GRPFTFEEADVGNPRPRGIRLKACRHGGRWLDIDDLATPQGERQRHTARTPSDIDYDVVRFDIRSDDRQVWTKRSEWIGLYKRMVGGASSTLISRRLRTAQPGALRKHGIDASSEVPLGCSWGSLLRRTTRPDAIDEADAAQQTGVYPTCSSTVSFAAKRMAANRPASASRRNPR